MRPRVLVASTSQRSCSTRVSLSNMSYRTMLQKSGILIAGFSSTTKAGRLSSKRFAPGNSTWYAYYCLVGRTPTVGTRRGTLPFDTGKGSLGCPKDQSTLRSRASALGVWNCSSRFGSPVATAATFGRLGSNCSSFACSASEAERDRHAGGAVACLLGCLVRHRHCRRSAPGASANTGAGSATTDPRGPRTWGPPRGRTSQGDASSARTGSGEESGPGNAIVGGVCLREGKYWV